MLPMARRARTRRLRATVGIRSRRLVLQRTPYAACRGLGGALVAFLGEQNAASFTWMPDPGVEGCQLLEGLRLVAGDA